MGLDAGATIADRYRMDSEIAAGGMGRVFRGFDARLERAVAIKVVRPDRLDDVAAGVKYRDRFLREARVLAKLSHPGIVVVHDLGEQEGELYLVMELLSGGSMRERMTEPDLAPRMKLGWLRDSAAALAAAHDASLVHRDVKPENLFVTQEGSVKVLDFGLARPVGPSTLRGMTQTGQVLGTPDYMAPEQIGGGEVDARADQFAWALVAHELLVGELPARGQAADVRSAAGVTSRLADGIHRALRRAPDERWPHMRELVRELEDALGAPVRQTAAPPTLASAEQPTAALGPAAQPLAGVVADGSSGSPRANTPAANAPTELAPAPPMTSAPPSPPPRAAPPPEQAPTPLPIAHVYPPAPITDTYAAGSGPPQHAQGQHAQGQHAQAQHAQGQHAQAQHGAQGKHAQQAQWTPAQAGRPLPGGPMVHAPPAAQLLPAGQMVHAPRAATRPMSAWLVAAGVVLCVLYIFSGALNVCSR